MFKLAILTILFIAVAYAHHPRNFTCTIANTTYNLVQGSINIEFNGTHTIFEVAVVDPNGKLHNTSNGFHIHQFGITSQSANCGAAGKHYNPVLNYGEISARAGVIPSSGVARIVTNWVNWEGDFTATGRSLVIHDNTTTRLGCCTIESGINNDIESGWAHSVLMAQFNGLNITFYNASNGQVNVNYTIDSAVFTDTPANISIGHAGSCTSIGDYKVGFPQLNGTFNGVLNATLATNFGEWAGRSVHINGTTGTYCGVLIQAAAQDNIAGNDFYVDPATTITSTTSGNTTTVTSTATATTTSSTGGSTSSTTTSTGSTGTTSNSMKVAVAIIVGLGILLI